MALINFHPREPNSYLALKSLVEQVSLKVFYQSFSEIKEGHRNRKKAAKLKISGKTFVNYCNALNQNEPLNIREDTLDTLVKVLEKENINSWEDWEANSDQEIINSKSEPQEQSDTRKRNRIEIKGILLAGLLSGFLVGILYLVSQDIFYFDEISFQKNGPRLMRVWLSHLIGGGYAGYILGIVPGKISQMSNKSVRSNLIILSLFILSICIFCVIIQAADRAAFLPCKEHEPGLGYLGRFDFEDLALAITASTGLVSLIGPLSKNAAPSLAESFKLSIMSALYSFLSYLVVYSILNILIRINPDVYGNWLIPCWFQFRFEHAERAYLIPILGFIYVSFLLNAPRIHKAYFEK